MADEKFEVTKRQDFSDSDLLEILNGKSDFEELQNQAVSVRKRVYGNEVFIRGLIEFSNICKNDCLYCGLRASNNKLERYRLSKEEILACCEQGYKAGCRTFVLQSGEDMFYTDDEMCRLIYEIKTQYCDCALTLSVGEKSHGTYKAYFNAGADRYLLRHETASAKHYKTLHPSSMSSENRKRCLFDLKEIGFQVGAGFMVGSPYQTNENIVEDVRFLQELNPAMIGIGPFVAHHATPFADFKNGSVKKTLVLISLLRLLFPYALIPATTALGSLEKEGYIKGVQAGANVLMPNISPFFAREKYAIYDGKIYGQNDASKSIAYLSEKLESVGYTIVVGRGDWPTTNCYTMFNGL